MNSPRCSTPSITSRMRGRSGSYCAFTSTRGIGRTASKSRLSAPQHQVGGQRDDGGGDRVLGIAEVVMETVIATSCAPTDTGEGERPERRADGGQGDVAPELHPEDPGRNRDEGADH